MVLIINLVVTLLGAILGISWEFALKGNVQDGLLYGSAIGLIFGIIICFFLKSHAGTSREKESYFLTVSILTSGSIAGIGLALVALILHLAFF